MINRMRKSLKKDIPFIIILFILTIGVQLFFLNPPILSDQMEYYFTAVRFPRLPSNPNIGSMRIGLELPVAVLYRIFGSSEIAYYALPLMSFALLSISIYLIGRSLFSRRVGFFSAVWVLFIPNLLLESGHLLPDVPATACSAAGFAILLTAFGDRQQKRDFSSRRSICLFLLAGFFFGWSYLIKEYLAILFLLIPLLFWILEIPILKMIPVAAAMLFMYGLEILVGIVYYQNPFIRFLAANPRETEGEIQREVSRIIGYFGRLLIKTGGTGILAGMFAGLANITIGSLKKDKRTIFLLSWILLIYGLFTFTGLLPVILNWDNIVLMRLHKFRYWIPILPPLVIAGVLVFDKTFSILAKHLKLLKQYEKVFIPLAITALLVVISMPGITTIWNDSDFIKNGYDHYHELRQYLKENDNPEDIIWIDRDNKRAFERILPMYVRNPFGGLIWHGNFKYINTESLYLRAEEIDIGYVIVDRDFMVPAVHGVPDYLYDPPANWKLVFESKNQKIALFSVN